MFSKKAVFESYLEQLGLNKTAFEAVKSINGVLFEGIDDLLDDMDENIEVSSVPEAVPEVEKVEEEPAQKKAEYTPDELASRMNIPFNAAWRLAISWAHTEPRFDFFWDESGYPLTAFMIPSGDGKNVYFSPETVIYEISTDSEDGVPKYVYQTATNPVRMSEDIYNRIVSYYGEHGRGDTGDLSDIPFVDIKRLALGNALHQAGEDAPNLGVQCTVHLDPEAIMLSNDAYKIDEKGGIFADTEKLRSLEKEYHMHVESMQIVLLKEWSDASDKYYVDGTTGLIYDVTRDTRMMGKNDTLAPLNAKPTPDKKRKQSATLRLGTRLIDWAKTQDMFRLLLKPNAAGVPKNVYTNTIYQVPNDGNIEGISGTSPYVYMDDDNYASYVNANPGFDQSQVKKFGVDGLNNLVKTEYERRSTSDTSAYNEYGYDSNGWVNNIECEVASEDARMYKLKDSVIKAIKRAYGSELEGINNYVAGKNIITVGGKMDLDGNVVGGVDCHPLVYLGRSQGGYLAPRLVAVFDETCCKPGEPLSKIVGESGLRNGTPTILGFATILNGCNLSKKGDFVINDCYLDNVDISGSTGFVKIGSRTSDHNTARTVNAPVRTVVKNTIISVGNHGADMTLPNNQIYGEMSKGMRGVTIANSVVEDSIIENGYAEIIACHLTNLNMSNDGEKRLKGWNSEDASNVKFKGDNLISVYGDARYEAGYIKSVVPGAKRQKKFESGDVSTRLTGNVTLDSSMGTVVCCGSTLNNVIANGPCSIRSCTLNDTTIGANAEAGGKFMQTQLNGVHSAPSTETGGYTIIDHGRYKPTIFGNGKKDQNPETILLSGKVYVEGGAQVFKSEISSPAGSDDDVVVRANMVLNGCSPYTLNRKDSGTIAKSLNDDAILRGDCTDAIEVSRRLHMGSTVYGGASRKYTPIEKYEMFKNGDMTSKDLTLYEAESIVEDFLAMNTKSVLVDKSVFMDITDDGIVPNERLKMTIWDPIGGFFVGPVRQTIDESGKKVVSYGRMILLKCPNVVLNHTAIIRKREIGQDLDFKTYASGAITLRQYVEFLENNGYDDCFTYVTDKNGRRSPDFVQLCLISNKDKRTPRPLTIDEMNVLCKNSETIVKQFLDVKTDDPNRIRDVEGYDDITEAYTDPLGRMVVDTDHSHYEYDIPKVDDVASTIVCTCSKQWRDDDGKTHYPEPYQIKCGTDAMYKAAYKYLLNSRTSANAQALDIIRRAIAGNTEGLHAKDPLSAMVNAMQGNQMKSNDVESVEGDVYNKILKLLGLEPGENVYLLTGRMTNNTFRSFVAKGKLLKPRSDERERYHNAACDKLKYRQITYSPSSGRFVFSKDARIVPVRLSSTTREPTIEMEHLYGRKATLEDFIRMGVPVPKNR